MVEICLLMQIKKCPSGNNYASIGCIGTTMQYVKVDGMHENSKGEKTNDNFIQSLGIRFNGEYENYLNLIHFT